MNVWALKRKFRAAAGEGGRRGARPLVAAVFLLLAGSLIFFPAGCASRKPAPVLSEKPLIWPGHPEPARIRFIKSISGPGDIGVRKGLLKRFVELVLGTEFNDIIKPYGVVSDSRGRVIVADTAFARIHIFDDKARKYSFIDTAGKRTPFVSLIGVAVDSSDNIYATDSVARKVYVFDSSGEFLFDIDGGKRPTGVAVNSARGYLYVVDSAEHMVRVFDLKGGLIKTFGAWGGDEGQFNYPVDIFVGKNQEVYIADTMNYLVQVYSAEGVFLDRFGDHGDGSGDFGRPKGLAADSDGNIYVADALFDTVQIFSRSGEYLLNFGRVGSKPGEFWMPAGVFIDSADTIYVADAYNKRIQVFEYLGDAETALIRR